MFNNKMFSVAVLSLALVGCSSENDDNRGGVNPEGPSGSEGAEGPQGPSGDVNVLIFENFEGIDNGKLPIGWDKITSIGEAYVEDGYLYIDGTGETHTGTGIELPQSLAGYGNYKIEVNFTISEAVNSSRWAGFKYRVAESDAYYQFAIRQSASSANGTELAARYDGQWDIQEKAAFSEDISADKSYKATIKTYGNRVQQSLNGQILHDAEILPIFGNIGLQAAGVVLKVSDIKISKQVNPLPPLDQVYDVNEPTTNVAMAPTIATTAIKSFQDLLALPVSNAWLVLDEQFNLHSTEGLALGGLSELIQQELNAIPVIEIQESVDIVALSTLLNTFKVVDLTFVSDNKNTLRTLREAVPHIRSAFRIQPTDNIQTVASWHKIVSDTTISRSRIVVVPQAWVNPENMAYLQRRLLTVWVVADDSTIGGLISSGANGLVVNETAQIESLLGRFPENSLLRKPLIIGHRGVPSLQPENTLESAVEARRLGVDGNEYDVYLSTDNHVVVIHDATVDRTTNGTGRIEELTLEEIKALNIVDLNGDVSDMKIPTLDEFFETFKGEDMTHFLEIKSANPQIVDEIKKATEKYAVADQLIVITFNEEQAKQMGEVMPHIPVGLLLSHSEGKDERSTLVSMLKKVQPLSTTYNPSYSKLSQGTVGIAKHRGVTVWPWTYRNLSEHNRDYMAGIHGLTTDYAQWSSDFITQVTPATSELSVNVNQELSTDATVITQDGTSSNIITSTFFVVESSAQYEIDESGKLVFLSTGTAEVLIRYFHELADNTGYNIFSTPMQVNII